MKKSLLALAVLGAFAGAVSAQSTVTLYGRLDLTVGKDVGTDQKVMRNGSGSRLGFRGVEDLGGGLQALFNIEHRFNADTGQQTTQAIGASRLTNAAPLGRFWSARSIVGFQSASFGRVVLGREYTTSFLQSQLVADPWGWDTVVTRGGMEAITGGGGASTNRTDQSAALATVRQDSSLTYNFTGVVPGLNVGVQISEGTDTITNTPNRPVNFAVSYGAGPIVLGFGHERNGDEATEKAKWTTFNGSFDLGFVRIGGFIGRGNDAFNADKKSWLVTAVAPIGSGELRAGVGQLKEDTAAARDVKTVQLVAVGYHYSLSKRTTVYADAVNNSKANLPLVGGVEKRGYDVGVKHNF